jgi:hypothetical protein
MIDCRYYRSKTKKSLTDGSLTSLEMRRKVSIDTIGIDPSIHRRLCPSMAKCQYPPSVNSGRPIAGTHLRIDFQREIKGQLSAMIGLYVNGLLLST